MNELWINGRLCDLSDFTRIAVTKQANNIGDIQDRNGNFTNTFNLPLTSNNIEIIGYSNDVASNSDIPYRLLSATYIQDGITLIAKGTAVIDAIDDTIEMSVTSGNANLSEAIGDLIVGDLYEGETLTWNLANVFDIFNYWLFPLIDWRIDIDTFFTTNVVDVREMLPVLKVNDLFARLEARLGFRFDGSFIGGIDFNSMILTPNEFQRLSTLEVNSGSWFGGGFSDIQNFTIDGVSSGSTYISTLVNPKTDVFTSVEFTQGTTPRFEPSVNKVGRLKYTTQIFTFRSNTDLPNNDLKLYIKAFIVNHTDSVVLSSYTTEVFTTRLNTGLIGSFFIDIETDELTFNSTKQYRCYFQVYTERFTVGSDTNLRVSIPVTKFSFNQTKSILFGSDLSFQDLFRMKVKDVFKDILNLRCLQIQTDDYSNITTIEYLNILKTRTPKNWTAKLHKTKQPLSFIFGKYARRNWLRFKENTNVTSEIGDYYFDVDNLSLEAESDIVKISHPATEQGARFSGFNIPKIKAINSNTEWQKPDYRILNASLQDVSIDYTDGTTTTTVGAGVFANFTNGQSIIENYYQTIGQILDKTKVVNLAFRLEPEDYENPDYLTPIYIEDLGLFYLNKIENFKDEITICELVRL